MLGDLWGHHKNTCLLEGGLEIKILKANGRVKEKRMCLKEQLPWVYMGFYTEKNINVCKVIRSHSLELEMIELNFPLLFYIMENQRYNVWVWILCFIVRENYTIWLKKFVYWGREGESNLGVIENSLMSLQGQKENVSNKESSPSHPWLYERKVPKSDQNIQFKPF